jgi:hypothetical protein
MTMLHFWIIMSWLSMIAAMIEKSKFRYFFYVCILVCSLAGALSI